ncbi:hypothetical protein SDRG_10999 [Saprolegnia diclina VS20]|uniref:Uncharacterized protein n=1 Tax=Saprolegnia diclina (strain VS20) TaxID=1156394 RepID=T0RGI8_SAPDV|nr:hypothetical protein SDRG_10999 [Saprolegnia diclina VS20]EQC31398.1 hypothetical protein SDRG_10999 [Saprolegnia diclina VS20]|eukprot:XP_008615239.1 hypothetical protein SDRG_10999 [Saprolegnia diclina VS20]
MNLEDSCESVDEDAELELSCALQDLAVRCKSFTAKMTDDIPEIADEEIHEDLECDPKQQRTMKRERSLQEKDWNYTQTKKELSTIQGNIRELLERLAAEAKAFTPDEDDDAKATRADAKRVSCNQRQEK